MHDLDSKIVVGLWITQLWVFSLFCCDSSCCEVLLGQILDLLSDIGGAPSAVQFPTCIVCNCSQTFLTFLLLQVDCVHFCRHTIGQMAQWLSQLGNVCTRWWRQIAENCSSIRWPWSRRCHAAWFVSVPEHTWHPLCEASNWSIWCFKNAQDHWNERLINVMRGVTFTLTNACQVLALKLKYWECASLDPHPQLMRRQIVSACPVLVFQQSAQIVSKEKSSSRCSMQLRDAEKIFFRTTIMLYIISKRVQKIKASFGDKEVAIHHSGSCKLLDYKQYSDQRPNLYDTIDRVVDMSWDTSSHPSHQMPCLKFSGKRRV